MEHLPAPLVDTLSDILADILVADLRDNPPDPTFPIITRIGPNTWDFTEFFDYFFEVTYMVAEP